MVQIHSKAYELRTLYTMIQGISRHKHNKTNFINKTPNKHYFSPNNQALRFHIFAPACIRPLSLAGSGEKGGQVKKKGTGEKKVIG